MHSNKVVDFIINGTFILATFQGLTAEEIAKDIAI